MLYLYHVNTFAYHELTDQITIGRTTGELVYGEDGRMSGKHAQITHQGGVVTVEDLGSKNLSVINRIQIPALQKIRIKIYTLLEIGSQQFILTDGKNMSLETLNDIMENNMSKAIVKLEKDKTSTNISVRSETPPPFEDPMAAKEKSLAQAEKEMATLESNARAELAKLDEQKEKIIVNAKARKSELNKKILELKSELADAQKIKTDLENKKKKIINIKDMAD